ncbi:ABC transporter ATP-binding protein [Bartonella sp. DGB1]|uniref:iron ABC transporter ATP-binding protein n=1 Tax=Bartonella sp. DGB1 TaxID=3239807 RepID=UPI003525FD10
MIKITGVSKKFGTNFVIKDTSLVFPSNKLTAIIGPNGAGKSTLLMLISRLLPMDKGCICVKDMDILTTPSSTLAKQLAILRQDNHLLPRITVYDLILFGRYPHTKGKPNKNDQEHVARSLKFLGLENLATKFLDELSGGQRQRAFIAMVLCQDTEYILLDEPLNNLDMKHAISIMRLLKKAAEELGKTIITVLHDINFASLYTHHIVAMRDGEVKYTGSPHEIICAEKLHSLYDLKMDITQIGGCPFAIYCSCEEEC